MQRLIAATYCQESLVKSPLARIRRQARKLKRAAEYDRHAYWRKQPVRPGTVLYESFSGNGALCNPEAIFRGLIADPEFAGFEVIQTVK